MRLRASAWLGLAGAVLLTATSGARAAEPVDLQLVLAVDVSGSVDHEEAQLQRQGYIAAFGHPQVIEAIAYGRHGRIAVTYFEWAGYGHNEVIADWTVVQDAATAAAFQDRLRQTQPKRARRTSISDAIMFGMGRFDAFAGESRRRVIDISGDGVNNFGPLVTTARDAAVAAGITINGLPIVNDRPSTYGRRQVANLDLYYEDCVIGGHSAFAVVAHGFEDFARAVRRKLILEIAGFVSEDGIRLAQAGPPPPGFLPAFPEPVAERGGRTAPPCNIGERRWRDLDTY